MLNNLHPVFLFMFFCVKILRSPNPCFKFAPIYANLKYNTQIMQQLLNTPLGVVSQGNDLALVPIVDSKKFSFVVNKVRTFFLQKGFVEVHTQNRLSILAACENPHSIATYDYCGNVWPLPQTAQMWLEHELFSQPQVPAFFCVSTS